MSIAELVAGLIVTVFVVVFALLSLADLIIGE